MVKKIYSAGSVSLTSPRMMYKGARMALGGVRHEAPTILPASSTTVHTRCLSSPDDFSSMLWRATLRILRPLTSGGDSMTDHQTIGVRAKTPSAALAVSSCKVWIFACAASSFASRSARLSALALALLSASFLVLLSSRVVLVSAFLALSRSSAISSCFSLSSSISRFFESMVIFESSSLSMSDWFSALRSPWTLASFSSISALADSKSLLDDAEASRSVLLTMSSILNFRSFTSSSAWSLSICASARLSSSSFSSMSCFSASSSLCFSSCAFSSSSSSTCASSCLAFSRDDPYSFLPRGDPGSSSMEVKREAEEVLFVSTLTRARMLGVGLVLGAGDFLPPRDNGRETEPLRTPIFFVLKPPPPPPPPPLFFTLLAPLLPERLPTAS
mmetsp:Transcript_32724/g.52681  ORF Transcript_32724/g.52681 Transcript_32724/m.52681 type:complete len:388 (+) Transcript_32724:561-1724(+)